MLNVYYTLTLRGLARYLGDAMNHNYMIWIEIIDEPGDTNRVYVLEHDCDTCMMGRNRIPQRAEKVRSRSQKNHPVNYFSS